ncbi:MAG TPA: cytochrome d ubiquinol oxidase subunit II [Terriglobales bacterium]|nr:cytochrome d ubiquinol oxidase subunit II [Terriglobales bacterium]
MEAYEILRMIWWAVLGILLIAIAVMDGFDLGTAILLPFVARTDGERRVVINTVGPVWEGNQVWFILGGGATFAAWPPLYAVAFSGFYFAMLLLLLALILRPVGFKFRSKLTDPRWRNFWDGALFVSGLVPALVFGVAFGNVLQGVPFRFDADLRMTYEGSFWALFNPFALLCGLVSVAMLTMHGAVWLSGKTRNLVQLRAQRAVVFAGLATVVLFAIGGFWVQHLDGYAVQSAIDPNGPSNPVLKQVAQMPGALLANYSAMPITMALPALGFAGPLLAAMMVRGGHLPALTWLLSALGIAGIIGTAGISLFPLLLPSSIDPNSSLSVWDASSSKLTLGVMTAVTGIFLPLIIIYTSWVYRVMRGPVTIDQISDENHSY